MNNASWGILPIRVGGESQFLSWEHSPRVELELPWYLFEEFEDAMLGKLFGAFVGERIAGEREGAKGAILGYGAASLAKRGIPTIAAIALGGWLFKKWRDQRRANAD